MNVNTTIELDSVSALWYDEVDGANAQIIEANGSFSLMMGLLGQDPVLSLYIVRTLGGAGLITQFRLRTFDNTGTTVVRTIDTPYPMAGTRHITLIKGEVYFEISSLDAANAPAAAPIGSTWVITSKFTIGGPLTLPKRNPAGTLW